MSYRRAAALLLGAVLLYFAIAACSLHFGLSRILFPHTSSDNIRPAEATLSVRTGSGNELLIRRYGSGSAGCVMFFPGQHGAAASYDFTGYVSAGLAILSLAYPGQDGARGRADLAEIEALVSEAIAVVNDVCPLRRMVFVGVSLGSMLAAYTSRSVRPGGLILLSAAPSLSAAIDIRLRSRWYLAPLTALPLSVLLPYDYSLADSLGRRSGLPVVIFQGTKDEQTPVDLLRHVASAGEMKLVEVPGATHSTTFALSQAAQVSAILAMLAAH